MTDVGPPPDDEYAAPADSPAGIAHRERAHVDATGDSLFNHQKGDDSDHVNKHALGFQDYTDESEGLNHFLFGGPEAKGATSLEKTTYNVKANNLHDSIKEHSIPHDIHVYAGTGFSPGRHIKYDEHGKADLTKPLKVKMPAFTSTSIDPDVAMNFAKQDRKHHNNEYAAGRVGLYDMVPRNIIKIHVPKGASGAYMHHHYSSLPEENEVLINKGAKLHIHPVPTVEANQIGVKHIWHARLVHDGYKKLDNAK